MSDNGHAFLLVFKVIGHSASFKRARREVLILVVLHQPRTYAWIFMTCGFNIKSSVLDIRSTYKHQIICVLVLIMIWLILFKAKLLRLKKA